ncbi:TonB-dependent receptor plug [Sphingobacterium sp. PM2-P1-29]|nr:TonB-dependent receptor plug [Sphingobacterium sp. PM2-P1-29]
MRQIFTIVLLLFYSSLYAQKYNYQGIIYSSVNDTIGLSNTTIQVLDHNISTRSQSDGHFSFKTDLAEGKLKVAFLGFKTREVPFSSKVDSPIIVYLDPDSNSLEEVQVIGYGQTTKRFNTGSVGTISAKEIEQQPVTNVLSALSGRMTGVYVQTTNGLPGGNINIQIRGTGSIQAGTNPLYIIDGVPYDGEAVGQGSAISAKSVVGAVNPLNILNPNDIENISVLKDADATAIYGSRGSNGVVLITTKKGKSGETRINLSLNQGFNNVAQSPKLLNLDQYLALRNEAFANNGRTPSADPASPDYAPDLTVWSQTEGTDWYEYIYGNTASLTNGQLSVSGGNNNTNFNVSGNFRKEGTILRGENKYLKGGLQSNLSHLSKNGRFRINLSTIYNKDMTDISNPANNINMVFLLPPNYPVFSEDGNYNWYAGTNLEAEMLSRGYSTTNNLVGNLFTTYKIPIGLELKVSGGYSHRSSDLDQIFPTKSLFPGTANNTMFGHNSAGSFIIEPQAEYSKDFSNSRLVALIGGTYQSRTTESMYLNASNFPNEAIMRNLGSAGTIDGRSNSFTEYKYVSAFSRLTYNLLDRYILNVTFRRDGSSRFGPANRFGNFYSLGGAWIVSDEKWFSKLDRVLSFGKLRVSYGQTGNDQIRDYQYLSTYQANGSNTYEGIGVLKPSRVFNSQFHWEVTKKLEFAMELGFLKDRLFFTINHYVNRSANQLVSYPLPRITGFSSYQANLPAVVQNTGWELDLNARLLEKKNFRWRMTANVTLPKNKLVKFDNIENSSYANTHRVGYDITRTYGYNFIGVDTETGLALYTDQDGVISDSPYRFHTLGKNTPDFYGGIGNELSYKNFQLSVFGQFAKQSHFGNLTFNQFGFQTLNGYKLLANRWMSIGDETSIPKVSSEYRDDISYFGDSNGNYYSVPYFRLKNVSLAYTLPNQIAKKLRCRSLGCSVSAQNLFTIWDDTVPILDPESGGSAGAIATIAPIKSIIFGINLSF